MRFCFISNFKINSMIYLYIVSLVLFIVVVSAVLVHLYIIKTVNDGTFTIMYETSSFICVHFNLGKRRVEKFFKVQNKELLFIDSNEVYLTYTDNLDEYVVNNSVLKQIEKVYIKDNLNSIVYNDSGKIDLNTTP